MLAITVDDLCGRLFENVIKLMFPVKIEPRTELISVLLFTITFGVGPLAYSLL